VKQPVNTKEVKQQAISEAIKYLTIPQRRKVLSFIILLPHQWNAAINESVKSLTAEECQQVLEFIATMPRNNE
jgi:hypothetical protein